MCLFMVQGEQTMHHSNKFKSFYTYICWHTLWAYGCFDGLLWEATYLRLASHFNYRKANTPSYSMANNPQGKHTHTHTHSLSLTLNLPHTVLACDTFSCHHLTCCHGYHQGFIASQIQAPGPMHSYTAQVEWIVLMPSQAFHHTDQSTTQCIIFSISEVCLACTHCRCLFMWRWAHACQSTFKSNTDSQDMSGNKREGEMLVTMLLCECVLETKGKKKK